MWYINYLSEIIFLWDEWKMFHMHITTISTMLKTLSGVHICGILGDIYERPNWKLHICVSISVSIWNYCLFKNHTNESPHSCLCFVLAVWQLYLHFGSIQIFHSNCFRIFLYLKGFAVNSLYMLVLFSVTHQFAPHRPVLKIDHM